MSGGGGSGGGGSQTITQTQAIPQYEQDFSKANQGIAQSIASRPYPNYQGQLTAGFTPQQQAAFQQANYGATGWQDQFGAAQNLSGQGANTAATIQGQGDNALAYGNWELGQGAQNQATDPTSAATVQQFMNPYVQASLAPQLLQLNTQLAQQQNQIGGQATQAGAFGDARQGVQSALANYYGNQSVAGVEAQGYNTAYNDAQQGIQAQRALGLQQSGQGQSAIQGQQQATAQQAQLLQAGAQQQAQLANQDQSQWLTGAQALYGAGQAQQNLTQEQLSQAYQQYQNQVNWPVQMLNLRESALSNSPYNIQNNVQLPGANGLSQSLGSFAGLAGQLGSLTGGSQTNGQHIFGGTG